MTRVVCSECGKQFPVPECGWLAEVVCWTCKACMARAAAKMPKLPPSSWKQKSVAFGPETAARRDARIAEEFRRALMAGLPEVRR
jgi:hypothetical protein